MHTAASYLPNNPDGDYVPCVSTADCLGGEIQPPWLGFKPYHSPAPTHLPRASAPPGPVFPHQASTRPHLGPCLSRASVPKLLNLTYPCLALEFNLGYHLLARLRFWAPQVCLTARFPPQKTVCFHSDSSIGSCPHHSTVIYLFTCVPGYTACSLRRATGLSCQMNNEYDFGYSEKSSKSCCEIIHEKP